jgi:hypothetical protein
MAAAASTTPFDCLHEVEQLGPRLKRLAPVEPTESSDGGGAKPGLIADPYDTQALGCERMK